LYKQFGALFSYLKKEKKTNHKKDDYFLLF
jgi:hypothetical protein